MIWITSPDDLMAALTYVSYTHNPDTRCSNLTSRTPVRGLVDSDTTTRELRTASATPRSRSARTTMARAGLLGWSCEQPEILEAPHALLLMFESGLLGVHSGRKNENSAQDEQSSAGHTHGTFSLHERFVL